MLLDTHAFLWAISDSSRLSRAARDCFLDPNNPLFFSAVSAWEISIKSSLGRLRLKRSVREVVTREMRRNSIGWLGVDLNHCQKVSELPFHHRDPFDRLIVSQALCEDLHLLSCDGLLDAYGVHRVW